MGDPVLQKLEQIEARLARLEGHLEGVQGVAATAGNTVDDFAERMPGGAADLDQRVRHAMDMLMTVSDPKVMEPLRRSVGEIGNASLPTSERVGLFSLLRIMREPEVRRTLQFLVQFSRRFGAVIDEVEVR